MTKNLDPGKYFYSGYGIKFDTHGTFPLSDGSWFGKNVTIFEVANSFTLHADNRKNYILILGEGPTVGYDDTILLAEA